MASQETKPEPELDADIHKVKEPLDFLLQAYRAKLAIDNPDEDCQFDFTEFLRNWKDRYESWDALREAISKGVEPLVNNGLFDSILPYLASSLNQSKESTENSKNTSSKNVAGVQVISAELTPLSFTADSTSSSSNSASASTSTSATGVKRGSVTSTEKIKKSSNEPEVEYDPEIIIHICDEAKSLKKDFFCLQSVLVREMGYFTKVTVKGQRLRDMDISVHCDIAVFEWLMKWVKSRNDGCEQPPVLDPTNVIGLMVSADFLQMANLVSECLQYTAINIGQIINLSPNLGCLNESLTNRILHFFNNFEVETRINHIDKSDRITSRIYTQLIMSLNDPEPDESLGHFASTATLFQCSICGQLLINNVASKIPCNMVKCDCRGRIYACHVRDTNWTLCQYIRDLKKELKLWKRVYWRLWSIVHFFCCSHCQQYFSAKDFSSCRYHPTPPIASVVVVSQSKMSGENEDVYGNATPKSDRESSYTPRMQTSSARRNIQLRKDIDVTQKESSTDIVCPYGIFPCCKQPSYQFHPFPSPKGCNFRDHTLSHYADDDPALKLIVAFRELIVVNPTPSDEPAADWSTMIDLTPQKGSSSANILGQKVVPGSSYGIRDLASKRRMMLNMESSSTESNSLSDTEELFPKTDENIFLNPRYTNVSDFWSWNPEYTTRYNQDMQREREEKLMTDLETLLAQRVAIDSGGSSRFPSTIRLDYLSRRSQKNNGGSFIRLEEKWREEVQQNGTKSGKSKLSKP